MLPIIRTFISLPAGVARMPILRFSVLTFLGCLPWVFMLAFIGKQVGANWADWKDQLHYVDYAVVALVVGGIVFLVVRARRGRGSDDAPVARRAGRRCRRQLSAAPAHTRRDRARAAARPRRAAADLLVRRTSRSCRGCCGWPYAELDARLRKAFEVALHAGTVAALLVGLRDEVAPSCGL